MTGINLDFENIYNEFQPKILRYLTRLVGEFEAEDLTQEVFAKVSRALKDFRSESQLFTWIYRIATNAAIDKLRSPSNNRMTHEKTSGKSLGVNEAMLEDKDTWTGEKEQSVEQKVILMDMKNCIRNFIENLPENYKTVIILSELEGLKNREVADILQVNISNVKIRLHRARVKLRRELESNCNFYRDEQNELACDLKSWFEEYRKTY